eukprot:2470401-Rhodomonas_salina.2
MRPKSISASTSKLVEGTIWMRTNTKLMQMRMATSRTLLLMTMRHCRLAHPPHSSHLLCLVRLQKLAFNGRVIC